MAKKYAPTPVFDEASFRAYQDEADVPQAILDAVAAAQGQGGAPLDPKMFDSNETLVFARQLETIKNRLYEKKYAALKGPSFVPMSMEGGLETEFLTYRIYDRVTLAILVENYQTDFPLVTASAREVSIKYHIYGNSYGYSLLDLRRAAKAGVQLESRMADIARQGHELVLDDEIAYGVPTLKTFGLTNHPNATLYTLPTGNWSSATGEQILADLNYLVTQMLTNTLEIWAGDTMLMSTAAYRLIATKLINSANGSNRSVLEAFKAQNPGISVESWTKLNLANATGDNGRIVFYRKSDEVLEFQVGRQFEVMPPIQSGMMISYPCISSAAGLVVLHPSALCYADNQSI